VDKSVRPARHVQIVPLGEVDQVAVSVVAANVQALTGLLADVVDPWPSPEYALIQTRMQYNALLVLDALADGMPSDGLRLGILVGDLCLPIFSHVFGEARVNGNVAVVSLYRLGRGSEGKPVERSLFLERLAKVAVHETAHALGLRHCRAPGCLMSFSLGLKQIDRLPQRFCPACAEALAVSVR
jgi:archaemetzincin